MNTGTARALCALNNEFYGLQAESFSATREAPWPGWERVADACEDVLARRGMSEREGDLMRGGAVPCEDAARDAMGCGGVTRDAMGRLAFGVAGALRGHSASTAPACLRVLDVACGNLRFERFLAMRLDGGFHALAVDSCDSMALDALRERDFGEGSVEFRHADVIETLIGGVGDVECRSVLGDVAGHEEERAAGGFDAVVSFGFMHHVPGEANRVAFLKALVSAARPDGIVAVSLWRFMDDERLARKAIAITEAVQQGAGGPGALDCSDFEPGDYLLGWKDDARALRYCHHFDDGEIARLAASIADRALLVDRYAADGKSGHLNEYLLFRRM